MQVETFRQYSFAGSRFYVSIALLAVEGSNIQPQALIINHCVVVYVTSL